MHGQTSLGRKISAQFALSAADQKRLLRLATAARSTPQRMLKYVLRDGFAYCEELVRRVNAGLTSAKRDKTVSNVEARVELHNLIARYGRRSRKAA